jgi:hypothetical protein
MAYIAKRIGKRHRAWSMGHRERIQESGARIQERKKKMIIFLSYWLLATQIFAKLFI